jgi:hypothetical protein
MPCQTTHTCGFILISSATLPVVLLLLLLPPPQAEKARQAEADRAAKEAERAAKEAAKAAEAEEKARLKAEKDAEVGRRSSSLQPGTVVAAAAVQNLWALSRHETHPILSGPQKSVPGVLLQAPAHVPGSRNFCRNE